MRYIKTQAIKNTQGQLIPIWMAQYVKTEYSESYKLPNDFHDYSKTIDIIWDLKKKEICPFRIKKVKQKPKFVEGQRVVNFDTFSDNPATITEVKSVLYDEDVFESSFVKRRKFDSYHKNFFTKEELDSIGIDEVVEFRHFTPKYRLKNEAVVIYDMYLKSISEEKDEK